MPAPSVGTRLGKHSEPHYGVSVKCCIKTLPLTTEKLFVSVTNEGALTEAIFTSKVTSVPIAGGRKVPVITDTLTIARDKDVSCPESECVEAVLGNNVKITFTALRGDTAAVTSLVNEAHRLLGLWRAMNADYGILPPATTDFATP